MPDLVIARYNEDVSWLSQVPDGYNIFLYNKGDDIDLSSIRHKIHQYVKLENIGRESDTYLLHMLGNMSTTDSYTVFSQADPFEHSPDFLHLLHQSFEGTAWGYSSQWKYNFPPEHLIKSYMAKTGKPTRDEIFSLYNWGPIYSYDEGAFLISNLYFLRAREAALQRRGLTARLEPVQSTPDYHRVAYAVQGSPLVSVIIPSKNNGKILLQCIQSFAAKNQWDNTEFVILDNGSDQPETLSILDDLRARKDVRMIRHAAPFNYSELNNIGIRASGGDILLFLNDDTELLAPDALARMIGYAQLPHVGAVGAKLLYPGGEYMQHTGLINLPSGPEHAFLRQPDTIHGYGMRNVLEYDWSSVTGACMMIERKKFDLIGGFNESFPVAYNDIEFCYRLLAQQFYNVICPSARFLHYESISRGSDFATAERRNRLQHDWQRLYAHHPSMFMSDPFYNPNLNQQSRDFTLTM